MFAPQTLGSGDVVGLAGVSTPQTFVDFFGLKPANGGGVGSVSIFSWQLHRWGQPVTFTDPAQNLIALDASGSGSKVNVLATFAGAGGPVTSVFPFNATTRKFGQVFDAGRGAGYVSQSIDDHGYALVVTSGPNGLTSHYAGGNAEVTITTAKVTLFELTQDANGKIAVTYTTDAGAAFGTVVSSGSTLSPPGFSTPVQVSAPGNQVTSFSVVGTGQGFVAGVYYSSGALAKQDWAIPFGENGAVGTPVELGGSVTAYPLLASQKNSVAAVWDQAGSAGSQVFLSRSSDGGKTFTPAVLVPTNAPNAFRTEPAFDSFGNLWTPWVVESGDSTGIDSTVTSPAGGSTTLIIDPTSTGVKFLGAPVPDARGDVFFDILALPSTKSPIFDITPIVVDHHNLVDVSVKATSGTLAGKCGAEERSISVTGSVFSLGGVGKRRAQDAAAGRTKIGVLRFKLTCGGASRVLPILVNDVGRKLFASYRGLKVFADLDLKDEVGNLKEIKLQTILTRPR